MFDLYFGKAFDGVYYLLSVCVKMEQCIDEHGREEKLPIETNLTKLFHFIH
jgi:hypothetical protein